MKKVSIVLMALVLFFIPLSSAFASTYDFKNGLLDSDKILSNNLQLNLYDNNLLMTNIEPSSKYTVTFTEPLDIDQMYFNGGQYTTTVFTFSDGTVIKGADLPDGYYSLSLVGITSVSIENTADGVRSFDEVEFFTSSVSHNEITNLSVNDVADGVTLMWDIPTTNAEFTGSKIYRDGELLATTDNITDVYTDSTAEHGTTYQYKVTALYSDDFETSGMVQTITTDVPVDDVAPADVTNVQYFPESESIYLTFDNPADVDFSKVNIYVDSVLHGSSVNGTYTINNLSELTSYSITLKAVDASGNEPLGVTQTIETNALVDVMAPDAPTGVTVDEASNGALVKWNRNLERDIQGYNIYVNGVKDNAVPVTSTSYQIIGLETGSTYEIQVSAVDTSNNESTLSAVVDAVPSADALPILELGFDLVDVADSTSNWFANIWLIVAFACSIPLAFYIANRVKLLFLG